MAAADGVRDGTGGEAPAGVGLGAGPAGGRDSPRAALRPGWARLLAAGEAQARPRGAEAAALAAVCLLAGAVWGWEAARAQFHGFYATAVRSMTLSWKAFVFGGLDPSASITIDKIPGFLWPQALSARLFGFHPWALALPQVIQGVVAVAVLALAVRRWAGPAAGLLAAAAFALTPVAASLFGKALEDAALTCALVLAAGCWQRAVDDGRTAWLVACGVFVGLGFQAKMMQAWAVLPAFGIAYLVAGPPRLRRRLVQLLAAGAACLAVSLSWIALVTFTPAADRPYIDGSTTNSAAAMVFGYNGLARFGAVGLSAAGTGSVAATQGGWGGGHGSAGAAADGLRGATSGEAASGIAASSGASGTAGADKASGTQGAAAGRSGAAPARAAAAGNDWGKLIDPELASQVGWLYPAAAAGMLFGLLRRGRGRRDTVQAGALMWTLWLGLTGLALSAGTVPHSTYLVALAPPLAALSALGITRSVAAYRAPLTDRAARLKALALPAVVAATGLWAVHLAWAFPHFADRLTPPFAACVAVVTALLTAARFCLPGWNRAAAAAVAAAGAVLFTQPAVWSLSVLDSRYAGSSGNANAGGYTKGYRLPGAPSSLTSLGSGADGASGPGDRAAGQRAAGGVAAAGARRADGPGGAGGFAGMNPFDPPATLDAAQRRLLDFVEANRDGARYLMATQSWSVASPYIMDDAAEVLPMGGFSGKADFPTQSQFQDWVRDGELRFVLLAQPGRGMFARLFTQQPGTPESTMQQVAGEVHKECTLVPAAQYGGVNELTAPLYACGAAVHSTPTTASATAKATATAAPGAAQHA